MKKFETSGFMLVGALLLLLLCSCSDPMYYLRQELKKLGYILYPTPVEFAGTGTIIGGTPKKMAIVANPQTCFPSKINGQDTNLRFRDETTLSQKDASYTFSGNAQAKFLQVLGNAAPSISAGVQISDAGKIHAEFHGVNIEYMDTLALKGFYENAMTNDCKDFLDKIAFVIQAIRVDQMQITLYHHDGGQINLTLDNINQYLSISANAQWTIDQTASLVITTPKYIGYQLGTLRKSDKGLSLLRSIGTNIVTDRWIFKDVTADEDPFHPKLSLKVPQMEMVEINTADEDFKFSLDQILDQHLEISLAPEQTTSEKMDLTAQAGHDDLTASPTQP